MTSSEKPGRRIWFIAAGLGLLTFLLFARAIGNSFVNYDDPDYVTANAQVQGGITGAGIRWALTAGVASNWHPLTWMSHQLDVTLFGLDPRGHHATSVLWHALNAALAFLALRRLTGSLWRSAFCAALFAWHPLRVESVAWVSERKDVLSGFFFFAVLWLYAGYVRRRREGLPWRAAYATTLAAFALGLMAKPMLVTLPCLLLLLDFWPLRRVELARGAGTAWERLVLEKLPFFVLVIASAVVTYHVQKAGGSVTAQLSPGDRLGNAVIAVVRYLGTFLLPVDLAVLYPHPGSWPARKVVAALLVVGALTAAAVWQSRRRPWIAVGWFWFLGTLVPVIGIVQVGLQSMADRYTYLTIVGVQVAAGWSLATAATAVSRRIWVAAGLAVLLGCAALTWRQIAVWRDSDTLFTRAIEATEGNYLAHDNRGLHRYKAGRVDEAFADYRASLAIRPDYMNANNNLGHALTELGRPAEAVPLFRRALAAQPGNPEVTNNLANALSDLNQLDEAMALYEQVLSRHPDHTNALNGSAVVLAMRGKPQEARARLERSLAFAPGNAGAHNNLGNVYSMLGDRAGALRHYQRATELNPREAHPHFLVGSLLVQDEKLGEAAASFRRAIALQPRHADALAQLGLVLARLGRRDEGVHALESALQLRPGDTQITAWLASVRVTP